MNYGSDIWGSKAWHLLHSFSNNKIPNDKIHNYFIFYTSFIYLLPCINCSEHYADIIYIKNVLNEEKMNRKYLMKWVFENHNLVNKSLNKPKYKYDIFLLEYKNNNPNHKDIFFILKYFILNINFDNISLYKYDQIYNFFVNFCLLYPEKKRVIFLKKIIRLNSFININTPNEFIKWFYIILPLLEEIICNISNS